MTGTRLARSLGCALGTILVLGGAGRADSPAPDPGLPYYGSQDGKQCVRFAAQWADADLAVLGKVAAATAPDAATGRGRLRVDVTETLKGSAPTGAVEVAFVRPECHSTDCPSDFLPVSSTEFFLLLRKGDDGVYRRLLGQYQVANGAVEGGLVAISSLKVPRAELAKFLASPPELIPIP